jgi:hypothetical protein
LAKPASAEAAGARAKHRNLMGFLDAFKAGLASSDLSGPSVTAGLVPAIHVFLA